MNMKKQRTAWGVGPKFFSLSVIFSTPVVIIAYLTHPKFVISTDYSLPFQIAGATLAFSGFIFYIVSVRTMVKAFKQNRLITTGVFGVCRNPIYGSWMIAMIPGIALFLRMPLLLLIPVIMYIIFRLVIESEERVLSEIFGDEYKKYRASVNAVFPTIHC